MAYQFALMPEARSMLEDIDRVSLIGSAADRLVTSLPELLATEREALLSQLMQALNEGSATVGALSGDVRSTLQASTETAGALNETLKRSIASRLDSRRLTPRQSRRTRRPSIYDNTRR